MVSVNGTATDERPTDTASLLTFLKTLHSPLLYERLKNAILLSPVAGNGSTANRLRQYERIRMPEQFMVMGDALCAFNPVCGQGMTVAALESQALANCLTTQRGREPAGSLQGLTTRFQQAAAALVANPWMLATSEEYRIVGTIGAEPGPAVKFMQWYLHKLLEACAKDQAAHAQLLRVIHMVDDP